MRKLAIAQKLCNERLMRQLILIPFHRLHVHIPWPSLTKVNLVNRYDRVLLNVDQFYFCKGISSNVSSNTRIMQ